MKQRVKLIVINANWYDVTRKFSFPRLSPFVSLIPHIWPIILLYDAYRVTWKSLREADLGLLTVCALLNEARVNVIWHNRKANLSRVLSAPQELDSKFEETAESRGLCEVRSAMSWRTWKGRLRIFVGNIYKSWLN